MLNVFHWTNKNEIVRFQIRRMQKKYRLFLYFLHLKGLHFLGFLCSLPYRGNKVERWRVRKEKRSTRCEGRQEMMKRSKSFYTFCKKLSFDLNFGPLFILSAISSKMNWTFICVFLFSSQLINLIRPLMVRPILALGAALLRRRQCRVTRWSWCSFAPKSWAEKAWEDRVRRAKIKSWKTKQDLSLWVIHKWNQANFNTVTPIVTIFININVVLSSKTPPSLNRDVFYGRPLTKFLKLH